jgi:hypothetical protein
MRSKAEAEQVGDHRLGPGLRDGVWPDRSGSMYLISGEAQAL